jgi:hypothetical protein
MTHLRKMMLEELERRNYAQTTTDCYIQTIATPFNLHNCLPTGGFLQTAVSDAPRTTSRTYLRSSDGAHPIRH